MEGFCNRCGAPIPVEKELCDRCEFYKTAFFPNNPVFETKKEVALRAIAQRKMMKGKDKFIVIT